MVMWVCEASEVNIWTVFAVRPNGPKITEVIREQEPLLGGLTKFTVAVVSVSFT